MTTPASLASHLCPACGSRNDCTLADAKTAAQPCWCYSVSIDPAVLQALSEHLRNAACLCPRCAQVSEQLSASRA
ncbi:cysteine-rich CWC family protein [Pseudomonas coleopterorum]|uniref:Cysteine-rich CWC family protein n=1 Tax=Pseudomonas coleopterorum TaxID=1605838 RepID=A0ABR9BT03_9PSED|nr:cysteine-rich CWC family protein [Pseudomonas coleopterorum]MBD8754762.1 cysteine-rich CWC family protein [Pseudomonas coleopterorum]MBD8768242.1 cysteine-rich CWC family protein [Pseudomonas coleopterorum]